MNRPAALERATSFPSRYALLFALRSARARCQSVVQHLPTGALAACVYVVIIHSTLSTWVFPFPVARPALQQKVSTLTAMRRPSMLIAGDSRSLTGIRPAVVCKTLGWPKANIINMADRSCDVSAMLAAYRAFRDRIANNPIMLINVSFFSANDHANEEGALGDEALWSMNLLDRLWLAPPGRHIDVLFLPEKALRDAVLPGTPAPESILAEGGFKRRNAMALEISNDHIRYIDAFWYKDPSIESVRWRMLEKDLRHLLQAGVQIAVLDLPEHPMFLEKISATRMGQANDQFHANLSQLCERLDLPLLRYSASDFPDSDPGQIFLDAVHLNVNGANRLSRCLAQDVAKLIADGTLHVAAGEHVPTVRTRQ